LKIRPQEIENVWEFQNGMKQEADQHGRLPGASNVASMLRRRRGRKCWCVAGLDRAVDFWCLAGIPTRVSA